MLQTARSGGAGATVALPYLLPRGASRAPYYKRQTPRPLRPLLGCSTITVRLAGVPGSKAFFASYSRAHSEADRRIAEAQEPRRLSAHEVLGVAGQWAQEAGPQSTDTTYAEEAAAVLDALQTLPGAETAGGRSPSFALRQHPPSIMSRKFASKASGAFPGSNLRLQSS